jgi:hypothetical protein
LLFRLVLYELSGNTHVDWHNNLTIIDKYIMPHLDWIEGKSRSAIKTQLVVGEGGAVSQGFLGYQFSFELHTLGYKTKGNPLITSLNIDSPCQQPCSGYLMSPDCWFTLRGLWKDNFIKLRGSLGNIPQKLNNKKRLRKNLIYFSYH